MALTTHFTELVGCTVPIQCAGMGTASPLLAVEVAKAGGLGMLSGVMMTGEQLETVFADVQANTTGSIGTNFLIPFLEDEAVIDVAAKHSRLVDFFTVTRIQIWYSAYMMAARWLAGRWAQ